MTDLRQAAQQALESLEYTTTLANFLLRNEKDIGPMSKANEAITSLRTALAMHKVSEFAQAQEQAEPFGYFRAEPFGWTDCAETDEGAVALYERPPQRKPLTIAEVEQILAQHNYEIHGDRARYIVRMTEAAHSIKENT